MLFVVVVRGGVAAATVYNSGENIYIPPRNKNRLARDEHGFRKRRYIFRFGTMLSRKNCKIYYL